MRQTSTMGYRCFLRYVTLSLFQAMHTIVPVGGPIQILVLRR